MTDELEQVMLYVGGSTTAFRCDCGCNVMHKEDHDVGTVYVCNGCCAWYVEDRDDANTILQ